MKLLWVVALVVLIMGLGSSTALAQDADPRVIDHTDLTGKLSDAELAQAANTEFRLTDRSVGLILYRDYFKSCMRPGLIRVPYRCVTKYATPLPGQLDVSKWVYYDADMAADQYDRAGNLTTYGAAHYLAGAEAGMWLTSYLADVSKGPAVVLAPIAANPPQHWMCSTTSLPRGGDLAAKLAPYNEALRREWREIGCDVLVDIADIQSHAPDGSACVANNGAPVICPQYTTEYPGGHPHARGLGRMAEGTVRGMTAKPACVVDQEQMDISTFPVSSTHFGLWDNTDVVAQTFVPSRSGELCGATMFMYDVREVDSAEPARAFVEVWSDVNGQPGELLATSTNSFLALDMTGMCEPLGYDFDSGVQLVGENAYWLIARSDLNYPDWFFDACWSRSPSDLYAPGMFWTHRNETWAPLSSAGEYIDAIFQVSLR